MNVWNKWSSSKKCGTTWAFQMLREDKIEKPGTFKACCFQSLEKHIYICWIWWIVSVHGLQWQIQHTFSRCSWRYSLANFSTSFSLVVPSLSVLWRHCFPKCGPGSSNNGLSQELIRNEDSDELFQTHWIKICFLNKVSQVADVNIQIWKQRV